MKLRTLLLFLVAALALIAGFFFWNRPQAALHQGDPVSPVLVHILTPHNAASVAQDDVLPILAQAWSPSPVLSAQLWVDGQLISEQSADGLDGPLQFSWDWQAAATGVHTLFVRVQDSQGEEGFSQTLLVNVDPVPFIQVFASQGQTLEEVSASHGASLADGIQLNPSIDPQQPLEDGQPLILPNTQAEEQPDWPPQDTAGADLVIHWQFTPHTAVDQSYCYQSTGGGWQRVPGEDFTFLPGQKWLQTALLPPGEQKLSLFIECWGWQDGLLKHLGAGQTEFDTAEPLGDLAISTAGFELLGKSKTLSDTPPSGDWQLSAPFALRKTQSVAECVSHFGGSAWVALVCDGLLNGPTKQYDVFVWEWQPASCWPTQDCYWLDQVHGFYFYELDLSLQTVKSVRQISSPSQKALGNPMAWAGTCFGVRAYAEALSGEQVLSEMATFCGEPVQPKELVLQPQDWLTTYNEWINIDCDGNAPFVAPQGSQVAAGMHVNSEGDCIRQGEAAAAVKFALPLLDTWTVQQANLRMKIVSTNYQLDSSIATNAKPLCFSRLGLAKQDWTGLSAGHYIGNHNPLITPAYSSNHQFLGAWGKTHIDVTGAVMQWMSKPASNHGVILFLDPQDYYNGYLMGEDKTTCHSLVDNLELQILYFAPGN